MADFHVRVTPRSSKNRITFGDPVKVWVTAPPVDGEANQAVIDLVAKTLEVPRSQVEILKGLSGRNKVIRIASLSDAEVSARCEQPCLPES